MSGKPHPPGPRSKIVGANLAAERVKAGLTQAELAEKLGWSQSTILNLEIARVNMRVEQLLDLARVLDIDAAVLLDGAVEP